MPHITFELSDNIIEKNIIHLLTEIHHILTEDLPTQLESCKTRVIHHQNFLIGNGDSNNAFIHIAIEVLQGRSEATLEVIANKILLILTKHFRESSTQLNLKISVAIKNLPAIYLRNN